MPQMLGMVGYFIKKPIDIYILIHDFLSFIKYNKTQIEPNVFCVKNKTHNSIYGEELNQTTLSFLNFHN